MTHSNQAGPWNHLCAHAQGLCAVVDWYSCKVLAWRLTNTMDMQFCVDALLEACSKSPAQSEKNGRVRKPYPSDITHKKFETIKPLLESARKITFPRRVDLHEIFCAVLYLLKSGGQWHMLPKEFPEWRIVHSYFSI